MAAKLTRLTHKIAIQLHLVAESCTICSSRSRRPVQKLLDTHSLCLCNKSWILYLRTSVPPTWAQIWKRVPQILVYQQWLSHSLPVISSLPASFTVSLTHASTYCIKCSISQSSVTHTFTDSCNQILSLSHAQFLTISLSHWNNSLTYLLTN
jgi:hypothetical protein